MRRSLEAAGKQPVTATYGCEYAGCGGGLHPIADDAVTGPALQTVSWDTVGASTDLDLR